jgi:hypothetical protein
MNKLIIGRKDKIDIPALSIENIAVKIDSGAYSSSIHCSSIEFVSSMEGNQLEVIFLDENNSNFTGKVYIFKDFRKKKVKSSTGDEQERFFIQLPIILFEKEFLTDFSLTRRNGLRNPVLLGRKLTSKRFIIDTSMTNVSYKHKKKVHK